MMVSDEDFVRVVNNPVKYYKIADFYNCCPAMSGF